MYLIFFRNGEGKIVIMEKFYVVATNFRHFFFSVVLELINGG